MGKMIFELTKAGAVDLWGGLKFWRMSHLIGIYEIRNRYARSRVGQFWLTISTGIYVTVVGFVWSVLWKVSIHELLPHYAVSVIIWLFISGTIAESATLFHSKSHFFINQGMDFSTAIYALGYRNAFIFLHNIPIVILIHIILDIPFNYNIIYAIPGIVILLSALTWVSYLFALLCVRYRDAIQAVQSFLTVAFFLTPILWRPEQVPSDMAYLVDFNPFAFLIAVVRDPLLGEAPSFYVWAASIIFACGGLIISMPIIGHCRNRIIYWI